MSTYNALQSKGHLKIPFLTRRKAFQVHGYCIYLGQAETSVLVNQCPIKSTV